MCKDVHTYTYHEAGTLWKDQEKGFLYFFPTSVLTFKGNPDLWLFLEYK